MLLLALYWLKQANLVPLVCFACRMELDSDDEWLQQLLKKQPDSDDEWMQELLTCHHAVGNGYSASSAFAVALDRGVGLSTPALSSGAGSSAPTRATRVSTSGAGSSAPTHVTGVGASGVGSSAPTHAKGVGAAGSSAAPTTTKAEARKAFILNAKSYGPLLHVSIPERLDVVIWDVKWWVQEPSMWEYPLCRGRRVLASWLEVLGPTIFKCGIAADPVDRYFNGETGYVKEERWHFMQVFWQGPADQCRQVEIDFIAETKNVEGCCNEKDGGDGVRPDRTHKCSVYLVLAAVGHGVSLKKSMHLLQQGSNQAGSI